MAQEEKGLLPHCQKQLCPCRHQSLGHSVHQGGFLVPYSGKGAQFLQSEALEGRDWVLFLPVEPLKLVNTEPVGKWAGKWDAVHTESLTAEQGNLHK